MWSQRRHISNSFFYTVTSICCVIINFDTQQWCSFKFIYTHMHIFAYCLTLLYQSFKKTIIANNKDKSNIFAIQRTELYHYSFFCVNSWRQLLWKIGTQPQWRLPRSPELVGFLFTQPVHCTFALCVIPCLQWVSIVHNCSTVLVSSIVVGLPIYPVPKTNELCVEEKLNLMHERLNKNSKRNVKPQAADNWPSSAKTWKYNYST